MLSILLLLSMWPFHHKKSSNAEAYEKAYAAAEQQRISDLDCVKQGDLYYYAGEDGLIAFSHAGCDAAKHNWKLVSTMNVVKMSDI